MVSMTSQSTAKSGYSNYVITRLKAWVRFLHTGVIGLHVIFTILAVTRAKEPRGARRALAPPPSF